MYPKLSKWIQQCVFCQTEGYNPDMPDGTFAAHNIKNMFPSLALDEDGACEQCRFAQGNRSYSS